MAKGIELSAKVRKEKLPLYVIFTDTETSESADGKLSLLLGSYEIWRVTKDGLPEFCVSQSEYYNEAGFYKALSSHLPCRVIAHNWAFDAAVLRIGARDNLMEYGYDIDVSKGIYPAGNNGYAPFLLRMDFGTKGYAELLCNTNYYKVSLAVIGNSLGLPKLDMPFIGDKSIADLDSETLETVIEYCRRDVEILRKAYFSLFEFTLEVADTTPGITAAMAANRVFRKGYYQKTRPVQGTQHIAYVNNAERAAYHGGRTDTFFKGKSEKEKIYKYDVNSLYPSCMLGVVPTRYIQRGRANWLDRLAVSQQDSRMYLADVTLHIPPESEYGFLGLEGIINDDGQLIFPVGRYRAWIWQPLVEIALQQGYVEKVHSTLLYETQDIFTDYILDMYKRRSEYKAAGNGAFDILSKLLMNSLYGKFAQREPYKWGVVAPDSQEYEVLAEYDNSDMLRFSEIWDGLNREYWQIGSALYGVTVGEKRPLSRSAVCSIAGYITARARAELWRAMAVVLDKGGELYMCDTDSVVADVMLPDSMVHNSQLGKFKLEIECAGSDTYFHAPKHYYMDGVLKLKGVRNPTDGAEHPQTVFPNFMTDLLSPNPSRRDRLDSGAVIRHIIKRPLGVNTKRIENGEGRPTLPIVVGYETH